METLLKPEYCDSITGTRNKKFGQYELRTRYPDRLLRSLAAVVTSCSVTLAFLLFIQSGTRVDGNQKPFTDTLEFTRVEMDIFDPTETFDPIQPKPETIPTSPPPPPKVEAIADAGSGQFEVVQGPGQQVTDSTTGPAPSETEPVYVPDANPGSAGPASSEGLPGGIPGGTPGETGTTANPAGGFSESEFVHDLVDEDPEFPGNLQSYLQNATRYPIRAINNGIEGQVFVMFVLNEKGEVTKPEILKGIGYGCDEEAIRVIQNMPNWKPANMNGRPVRYRLRIPLKFKLKN